MRLDLGSLPGIWHADLSQLHYIPVSQLYAEIYNIHAYFSGPSKAMLAASNNTQGMYPSAGLQTRKLDGDAELHKIAKAGRDWMFEVGRKIDMESKCGIGPQVSTMLMESLGRSLRVQVVSRVGPVVGRQSDGDDLWLRRVGREGA